MRDWIEGLFDISGKTAIVTGGSRGLGQAIVTGLAAAGAKVVAADVLDLVETLSMVRNAGGKAIGIKADVRKRSDAERVVRHTVEEFGGIDILVNNAGVNLIMPSVEMTEEEWDLVLNVNLKGSFFFCQAAGQAMIKQQSGKIINISSINGEFVFPNAAAYNASKAGVLLLTKTLAYEWGKYNINVNAICPGFMETSMLKEIQQGHDDLAEQRRRQIPLGRFAMPEDLVGTVLYLVSPASDYVTGHALYVDGGWTLGWSGVKRVPLDPKLVRALQESSD
jgi:2-deoxy-D-gluconate 3-dehydrogenase